MSVNYYKDKNIMTENQKVEKSDDQQEQKKENQHESYPLKQPQLSPVPDNSQGQPLFSHFDEIGKNPSSLFPYNMIYYPGNHSDTVHRIAIARGFQKVFFVH